MIIPIVREHRQDEYVVCIRAPTTVAEVHERMLQRAKVIPNTYAYRLIDNLHAAIFVQSLDLKGDYEAYFAREYKSFADYLRRRERFATDVISALEKLFETSNGMYYFQRAYGFLAEEYGLNFIAMLVEDPPIEGAV